MLQFVPFAVMLVAVCLALALPVGRDIRVAIFLLPWFGLAPDLGVNVAPAQLVVSTLLLKYGLKGRIGLHLFPGFGLLATIVIVCSLSAAATFGSSETPGLFAGGIFRNGWFRSAAALISFALTVGFFILLSARGARFSPVALLKVYVTSTLIACVLAIVQFLFFLASGHDLFPIGMFTAWESSAPRSAISNVAGTAVLRPTAFAGEPKTLGMFATAAMIVIAVFGRSLYRHRFTVYAVPLTMLATILLTQSSSALLSLAVGTAVYLCLSVFRRPLSRSAVFAIYVCFAIALMAAHLNHVATTDVSSIGGSGDAIHQADNLTELLYNRTVARIATEDFDYVILKSFLDDPSAWLLGRGFGLGHLFVEPYIPAVWAHYMEGGVVFPKSGLTYFLTNGGLIAVLLILLFFPRVTPSLEDARRVGDKGFTSFVLKAQLLIIPLVIIGLMRIYILNFSFLAAAVLSVLLQHRFGMMKSYQISLSRGPRRAF